MTGPFRPTTLDDSPRLLEDGHRLRYQVYCLERRFLRAEDYPNGLESDQFDRVAVHVGVVDGEGALVATARVVPPSSLGLPLLAHCQIAGGATTLAAAANAQDAGRCFAESGEVRAIFVTEDDGRLLGVVTRKTLVREVVAAGLEPAAVSLRAIAEPPNFTLDAGLGLEGAFRFLDALHLIGITNNLGDAKSLVTHPTTTTHQRLTPEQRAELGIGDGLVRFSAGLEHPDDLCEDLLTALEAV